MNIKTTSGFSIIFIGYSIYVIILSGITTTLIEYPTLFKQLYESFYLFHNSYEVTTMVEFFFFAEILVKYRVSKIGDTKEGNEMSMRAILTNFS